MSFGTSMSYRRLLICVLLAMLVCFAGSCKRTEDVVVVRLLLPPGHSRIRDEVMGMEHSRPKMDSGRDIAPATIETMDDLQFRAYLKDIQVYRPQIVVVSTKSDIPLELQGQISHAVLPCAPDGRPCISVLTPWGTDEERSAASIVQARLWSEAPPGADEPTKR